MNDSINKVGIRVISRPGGTVAYEAAGDGPLIVCIPGMGEPRSTTTYRFLAPVLVAPANRSYQRIYGVTATAAPGSFQYDDGPTAGDITAAIEQLGGPAIIAGNSLAAGSAVLVAAARPELVAGLVLVCPPATSALQLMAFGARLALLWARLPWTAYLPKLYVGRKSADFAQYRAKVSAAMKKPRHAKAFGLTTHSKHHPPAALSSVTAPTLVIQGEAEPNFPDPPVEAQWFADQLKGTVRMVPKSGHYPQAQRPDLFSLAVEPFADEVHRRA